MSWNLYHNTVGKSYLNETIRQRWGDPDTINIKLIRRRMQWLGHLAQMRNHRIPKMCFFGWLSEKRPQGGPKKCWKDIIRKELNDLNIPESCWYDLANKPRSAWKDHYHACLESPAKCNLVILIYKLLSSLNATEVSDALVTCRDTTNALLKEKNLYMRKTSH